MGMGTQSNFESPFAAILNGEEPGTIIVRDNTHRFALIESVEPEAEVHWIAVPFETGMSTEQLEQTNPERFMELVQWSVAQAKAHAVDHPALGNGFTIKFHFGAYETIPHAKLHILSVE